MRLEMAGQQRERAAARLRLGTAGHLGLFLWSLLMVMLAPGGNLIWMAGVPLIVLQLMYPGVWRGALTGRRLVLLGLIAVPPLFLVGEVDRVVLGVGLSSEGVRAAVQIALRFVVVIVALEGMTNAVEIAAIAGLLERLGLKGLGFSMGVALNLLPCLQQSLNQSWQTLKMRGGLRKQWWRGLRLFALTASSCALMRAEEIALAAEARGFHPEKARPMGTQKSRMDWVLLPLAGISLIISLVL